MPVTLEQLQQTLNEKFPQGEIKITDLAGDNDQWSVEIKHPSFASQPRIAQHKAVQQAVSALNIHALQIKTLS